MKKEMPLPGLRTVARQEPQRSDIELDYEWESNSSPVFGPWEISTLELTLITEERLKLMEDGTRGTFFYNSECHLHEQRWGAEVRLTRCHGAQPL